MKQSPGIEQSLTRHEPKPFPYQLLPSWIEFHCTIQTIKQLSPLALAVRAKGTA